MQESPSVWFLEGPSSQREVVRAVKAGLGEQVKVIASHRQNRPEITDEADMALHEPSSGAERIDWVLTQARQRHVALVHAGRSGQAYEAHRASFQSAGIQLVTGALSVETFEVLRHKSRFTALCEEAGLPVTPCQRITDADMLDAALNAELARGPACVKPDVGIFGQGFWKVDPKADAFAGFANADDRLIRASVLIEAYRQSAKPQPLLVMPYLPGPEYSIDMLCEAGEVIEAVSRLKDGLFQRLDRQGLAMERARAAAHLFGCDGLINIQLRVDAEGELRLLEINPRPSGGIGYTLHCGINLPALFVARRLGLSFTPGAWREQTVIRSVTEAVTVTGV